MKKIKDLTAAELADHASDIFMLAGNDPIVGALVYRALTLDPYCASAISLLSHYLNDEAQKELSALVLEYALTLESKMEPSEIKKIDDLLFFSKWTWGFTNHAQGETILGNEDFEDRSQFIIDEEAYQGFISGHMERAKTLENAFQVAITVASMAGGALRRKDLESEMSNDDLWNKDRFEVFEHTTYYLSLLEDDEEQLNRSFEDYEFESADDDDEDVWSDKVYGVVSERYLEYVRDLKSKGVLDESSDESAEIPGLKDAFMKAFRKRIDDTDHAFTISEDGGEGHLNIDFPGIHSEVGPIAVHVSDLGIILSVVDHAAVEVFDKFRLVGEILDSKHIREEPVQILSDRALRALTDFLHEWSVLVVEKSETDSDNATIMKEEKFREDYLPAIGSVNKSKKRFRPITLELPIKTDSGGTLYAYRWSGPIDNIKVPSKSHFLFSILIAMLIGAMLMFGIPVAIMMFKTFFF